MRGRELCVYKALYRIKLGFYLVLKKELEREGQKKKECITVSASLC